MNPFHGVRVNDRFDAVLLQQIYHGGMSILKRQRYHPPFLVVSGPR